MSPRLEDRHQGGVTDEFWFHSEMKVFLRSINQEEIKRFTLQSDCYPAKKSLKSNLLHITNWASQLPSTNKGFYFGTQYTIKGTLRNGNVSAWATTERQITKLLICEFNDEMMKAKCLNMWRRFSLFFIETQTFSIRVFLIHIFGFFLFSLSSVKLHIKQDHSLPGCEVYGHIRDASVLQVEGEHSYLAQNSHYHHFEIILSGNGMQKWQFPQKLTLQMSYLSK